MPDHHRLKHEPERAASRLLAELGARLNARNPDGVTPLHVAARYSRSSEIVLALLKLGADHRARTAASPRRYADAAGETAWELIQENESLRGSAAYWQLNELRF